jgi:hypothetical protein
MRILFDLGHPAHVHLFRNAILELRRTGHETVVCSRAKDVTEPLLEHYGIPFHSLSRPARGLARMAGELRRRTARILALHRERPFDQACGTSVSIGFLSRLAGVPSFNFNEDDDATVPLYAWLAYPLCDHVVNPDCLRFRRWRGKRLLHRSYHELAYLHPDRFRPDPEVPRRHGLEPGRYAVLRLSALAAHHDVRARGLSRGFVERLDRIFAGLDVVRSVEGARSHRIPPWDFHHVLAFARLLVADSQTMTIEAAVLGVPAVRVTSFVGRSSVLEEIEERYGLALGFPPSEEDAAEAAVAELLADREAAERWRGRRRRLLADKVDLTAWMFEHVPGWAASSGVG